MCESSAAALRKLKLFRLFPVAVGPTRRTVQTCHYLALMRILAWIAYPENFIWFGFQRLIILRYFSRVPVTQGFLSRAREAQEEILSTRISFF